MKKHNDLVSYSEALQLKMLGFSSPTCNRYNKECILNNGGGRRYGEPIQWNDACFQDGYRDYVSAPTYGEALDFLNEDNSSFYKFSLPN